MQTAVIGAVEYTIDPERHDRITARYLSTGSMLQGAGIICRGEAEGDTTDGFAGTYRIRYYGVDGAQNGEFDWELVPVGESFRLTWRQREGNPHIPVPVGDVVFEGFGFPNGERSIVVGYWMTEATTAAMAAARAHQVSA